MLKLHVAELPQNPAAKVFAIIFRDGSCAHQAVPKEVPNDLILAALNEQAAELISEEPIEVVTHDDFNALEEALVADAASYGLEPDSE